MLVDKPPAGDRWVHEIKLEGYRTAARIEAGKSRMLTRKGLDWTARFAPIAEALAKLPTRAAYLDGEIAILGKDGISSFADLQEALSRNQASRLTYFVFDLLHLDGHDLTGLPLLQRKQALEVLMAGFPKGGPVHCSEHVTGNGLQFFKQACKLRLEGIVSKLASGFYRSARGRDWLKVKCVNRQEFVVGGWMESEAAKRELRSLLVGYYTDGQLIFAGRVGTGFSLKAGRDLMGRLRRQGRNDPPFASVPREYRRGVNWVEPRMVVEVKYTTWTSDGILRHPAFEGVRGDKPAESVVIERPLPACG
jgi:bifunctional non-homologous end joining protein LigD